MKLNVYFSCTFCYPVNNLVNKLLLLLCVDFVTGKTTLIRTWKISRSTWEKFPVTSALYLVRSGCPNYQGMPVSHPPYVINCF